MLMQAHTIFQDNKSMCFNISSILVKFGLIYNEFKNSVNVVIIMSIFYCLSLNHFENV